MSKHQRIVKEIVNNYRNKNSTIAITVFGSVSRNDERPDSDVDMEIIIDSKEDWKIERPIIQGIKVDLVICTKSQLSYQVEKYPFLCYDYLHEKILYDPTNFMKNIQQELSIYFKQNPTVADFWEKELKIMRANKTQGSDLKNAREIYDKAELLFSPDKKITRNFFKNKRKTPKGLNKN